MLRVLSPGRSRPSRVLPMACVFFALVAVAFGIEIWRQL